MTPLSKRTLEWIVKGESTLTTFKQKQVKKWDQNVTRAKIFFCL